jgi:lipopolysaccharide exporter
MQKETIFGLKWTMMGSGVQIATQVIQLFFLAMILGPTQYGEAMFGLIVIRVMMPLASAGIGTVLIGEDELDEKKLRSLFTINLLFALGIYLFLFLTAPFLEELFGLFRLSKFIKIAALSIIIAALGNIHNALINKNLAYDISNKILSISLIFEVIVSLLVAFSDWNIWALTLGYLSRVAVATVLQIWHGKKYFSANLNFDFTAIKPILNKCYYDMGAQFTNMMATNIDNFLVSKYFGITNLGYYTLAWDLAMKPVYAIVSMFTKVKFPIWAKLKNEGNALTEDYEKTVVELMKFMCGIFVIWFIVSTYFIPFWYGEKWLPTVPLLHIFIILGIARSFGSPSSYLGMSLGFFKQEFFLTILQLFLTVFALFFVTYFDRQLQNICISMVVCYFTCDLVWYSFLHKNTSISFISLGKKIFPSLLTAFSLMLIFYFIFIK